MKKVELYSFSGGYCKQMEIRGYSRNMLKKWSYSVFPCLYSRRVHFSHSCHDYTIEDCSKIRNKA